MLIYEALKRDHENVKELLGKLVDSVKTDHLQRRTLLRRIRDELVPHSRSEEAIFYNSLREFPSAKKMARHSYREHFEAEALLRGLLAMDTVDLNWEKGALKLQEAVIRHIADEETQVFAAAKALFDEKEAQMMGDAFESLKAKIREGGFVKNFVDLIANRMPERFRAPLRKFTQDVPETATHAKRAAGVEVRNRNKKSSHRVSG